MRKLFYLLTISGSAFMFQSCGNSPDRAADANDTTMIADDTTFTADDPKAGIADNDSTFANKAAVGGMGEVEFGQLALQKASSAAVKDFASTMVKDHGKANEELKAIAAAKSMTLPAALDAEHATKKQELESKSGAEFDQAYVMAMVEGHEKTLALMEDGSQNCKDAELKGFAAKTAPVVKHHLEMIRKIQADMK